jgi:peptidoglycan/xylan/chitin deacetylase (PgdA/CDA1 family)
MKRALSLALALVMVAMLLPVMTATANIPAANRAIIFPIWFSTDPNNGGTGNGHFYMGFNHINSQSFLEFDVTQPGTHVLTLGPWWRTDRYWLDNHANLYLLNPNNPSGTRQNVWIESIAVGSGTSYETRMSNQRFWRGGTFWNEAAGTYFGNINIPLSTGAGTSVIPGFSIQNFSVPVDVGRPRGLQVDGWTRAGRNEALGTINSGQSVRITVRVGGSIPPVFGTANPNAGDVNGDGVINASDVTLLRRYIARGNNADGLGNFVPANANVTGVGGIGAADVTLLREFLAADNPASIQLGGGAAPVPPPEPNPYNYRSLVALTYDDGPHPNFTAQLLDQFQRFPDAFGVTPRVSFYVQGQKMNSRTLPIIERMIREGHSVENHSWDHEVGQFFGARDQMDWTNQAIFDTTGIWPFSFRAPRFEFESWPQTANTRNLRYHHAVHDTRDFGMVPSPNNTRSILAANELAQNILGSNGAGCGRITLMHDDGGSGAFARQHVVDAVPRFVRQMQNQGAGFVTVPQLHKFKERYGVTPTYNWAGPYSGFNAGGHFGPGGQPALPAQLPLPNPIDSWT